MRTTYRETTGRRWARTLTVTFGFALSGLLLPAMAAAQQDGPMTNILLAADGSPGLDLRTVRPNGFQLFAAGDAAFTGLRMTGNHGAMFSNYADCTNTVPGWSCQNERMNRAVGGSRALWFYNSWIAAAPPSEWRKLRDVAPSVNNALGGGFTAGFNDELVGGFVRFGPADLTLGRLFSGISSTDDGTCRDNTGFGNGRMPAGQPLLAQSICTDTWGSAGWEGAQRISQEGYADYRAAVGAAGFNFDFWRVPGEFQTPGFFGNLIQAYGETTDYFENVRNSYGSVIPGGAGTPALEGYPLGLDIRFDVFSFAVPSVNAAKFVRAMVINRSEDVYGTGVDYDSLYFGISPGDLGSAQTGTAWYNLPELNAVVRVVAGANNGGAVVPCNQSFREPVFGCNTSSGWDLGSQAIVFLKSPLGDMRNKLFTRTAAGSACIPGTDPFCDPSNPLRSDTFTINQTRMCGFLACHSFTWLNNVRSGFGLVSGTEDNTLAGRDIDAATPVFAWSTFRSPLWPDRAHFSKYQPDPNWDYNHDGVPDTLGFVSCHTQGCAGLASDTQPGGFVNLSSNVGGLHAAGPFALAAGDTTSFWYAVIGERDSVSTMSQVNSVIDLYLNFFLAPEAPPPAAIVTTQLTPNTDALGTLAPQVQIFFSDDPQRWSDPFLLKQADDIDAAPGGTLLNDLATANPGLANLVRARAVDNLERIEVYKSCDAGTSFTNDADCVGDPAADQDGNSIGLGWQAYRTFDVDAPDGIPSSFTDVNVQGGRSYLYVIIGKSRGATFLLNDATGAPIEFEFAPSIRNVLSRSTSDPNVVSIYVPASRTAGYIPASVSVTSRPLEGTVPLDLSFSQSVVPGSYTATIGNRITLRRDSLIGGEAYNTTVTVERVVTADVLGTAAPVSVFSEDASRSGSEVFPFAGGATDPGNITVVTTTIGDTVSVATTYADLGFVISRGTQAFFGSTTLTGADATPNAAFTLPDYPGFLVSVDNTVAGEFNQENHVRSAATIDRLGLTAADTLTPRNIVNAFMPQWQEGSLSNKTAFGGGVYEITWTGDAFGAPDGFVLNRTNPPATAAEVQTALQNRVVGATSLTDAETAALVGLPQTDLRAARMPFTIRNTTFGRDVRIATPRRTSDRIVLGTGQDTVSVDVPVDEWVPGDPLILIEDVTSDSATSVGLVLSGVTTGAPIPVTHPQVTFSSAIIGCNTSIRLSCNPVPQGSLGASGWNPIGEGDRTVVDYYTGLQPGTQFTFSVTAPVDRSDITSISDSALALIRMVPNPFVVFSAYQTSVTESRVLFTNLPPTGTLRIYTVAGQFTQEITWGPADLDGDGDLFFNLRTREGIDMASGLYIWVVNAPSDPTNPNSASLRHAGKFVIIRGSAQ